MSTNVSDTSLPASITYPYADGEAIPQHWSGIFIFFAFITSFVASYSAVRLLDHTLWRSEKEKEHASAVIIKYPQILAAFLLGFGTVWSMHFVGMAAVTLDQTHMCYNWPMTLASLVSSVAFMWAGVSIASRDLFRGPDRVQHLKDVVVKLPYVTSKGRHKEASRAIHTVAFFYKPWYILGGATVAATGALIMHYTGMMALGGPFQKRWSIPFVAASVILGVVVCCAGFWILFRLLLWKVEQFWLRPASAAVIAVAVCSLHFFGMVGVTYVYDSSLVGTCARKFRPRTSAGDPDAWTPHQILALAVALGVPSLALLIENLISRELFHAYCSLKNPSMDIEHILRSASRSHNSQLRQASLMISQARSPMEGPPLRRASYSLNDLTALHRTESLMGSAAAPQMTASAGENPEASRADYSILKSRRGSSFSVISNGDGRGSNATYNTGRDSCEHCACACHSLDLGGEKKEMPADPSGGEGGKRVSFCAGEASADEAPPRGDKGGGDTGKRGKTCSNEAQSADGEAENRLDSRAAEEAAFALEEGRSLSLAKQADVEQQNGQDPQCYQT